jgi:hypothetical protein
MTDIVDSFQGNTSVLRGKEGEWTRLKVAVSQRKNQE